MTTDDILDGLIDREDGYVDDEKDRGGATNYGITARVLGEWRKLGRPATRAEVQALTVADARQIYGAQYVRPFDGVKDDRLKAQLIDYGVNSGVMTAIKALQTVLGVPVDGVLGDRTLIALRNAPTKDVNNRLVIARIGHYVGMVDRDQTQRRFLLGWIRRAVSFAMKDV